VIITSTNARVAISVYAPDIIRVRGVKGDFKKDISYAVVADPIGGFSSIREGSSELVLSTESLKVVVTKNPLGIQFFNKEGKLIDGDEKGLGIGWQGSEVTSYRTLFPEERFIGLGEKTGPLDRRGMSFVNWNTDHPAYGEQDDPLYVSVPFFIGLHDLTVYGIFFDNSSRTVFDFGASTDSRFYSFSAADGNMNYYFLSSSSVAGVIEKYTYLTGRMKMPPYWSLGYQQCRWSYYPDTEVLNLARTFRSKKIPADVIYLDIHYMDGYKIFTWHPERFPRPKEMIDSLKSMGFHVVTIVDPGIKIEKGYFAYEEGIRDDYFAKYPGGDYYVGSVWPGRCHFPDFTKKEVREWWGKSFSALTRPGVEGFWNDMNEPAVWGQKVPDAVRFYKEGEGGTIREIHNVYGLQMARSTFEGTKSLLNGKRTFVLTRAAFSGIQRYSAVWTGDNFSSDEHMMLAVRLVNSMGISGIAFTGPDVGGFAGDPSAGLFARWMSIGAYTPFFRNHKEYGMKRQEPWSFGEEVEGLAKKFISWRYQLLPYIYSAFHEASRTGLPVARSLAIDYPFNENIYREEFQNEYLFGDNFLIAPASSKEKYCKVYLPQGGWYRLGSEQLYAGDQSVIVESPLEDLPVFVRAGGVITVQSLIQSTSVKPSDTLQIHVYYGNRGSNFVYYEDDGQTYEYEKGVFHRRTISFDPPGGEITLSKVEGSYASKFKTVDMILHGFEKRNQISVNGKTVITKSYNNLPNVMQAGFDNSEAEIKIKF